MSFISGIVAAQKNQTMIMTWETTSPSESITIPAGDTGTYNAIINWGDGTLDSTITTFDDVDLTHSYTTAGIYTVTITGTFPWIYFNNGGDKLKIQTIDNWGDLGSRSFLNSFYGCTNLVINALDGPNLNSVITMNTAFRNCININPQIYNWDTSNIRFMSATFDGCSSFNRNLSDLDTSLVQHLTNCLRNATSYDQDLGSMDVTSLTIATNFLNGVTLSTSNYDSLLIGWEGQSVQNNVNFHGGNSKYSAGAAATARAALISDHTWTITDGGQV